MWNMWSSRGTSTNWSLDLVVTEGRANRDSSYKKEVRNFTTGISTGMLWRQTYWGSVFFVGVGGSLRGSNPGGSRSVAPRSSSFHDRFINVKTSSNTLVHVLICLFACTACHRRVGSITSQAP